MADRDVWVRTLDAARHLFGPKARLRVTLIDPNVALAFCAVAMRLTTHGPGAEEVASAFGHSDIEALDALTEELRNRKGHSS